MDRCTGGIITEWSCFNSYDYCGAWGIPAALTQEGDTPNDDVGGIAYFVGSGGANGVSYPVTCTVTYNATEIPATDLTQDQSLTLILEEQ